MTSFEWFLLVIVVIVVPLAIAVVVTLWTIDQANKRKRANRKDAQIGVKRQAALTAEEVVARKAARAEKQAAAEAESAAGATTINNLGTAGSNTEARSLNDGNTVTISDTSDDEPIGIQPEAGALSSEESAGESSESSNSPVG